MREGLIGGSGGLCSYAPALKGGIAGTVCSYAPALKDGIGIWTKVVFRNGPCFEGRFVFLCPDPEGWHRGRNASCLGIAI